MVSFASVHHHVWPLQAACTNTVICNLFISDYTGYSAISLSLVR